MSDTKISALPAATTPLAGTEVLPIVQSSTTKQVSVANLTAGRTVTVGALTSASATALTLQSAGTTAITVDTSQNVGIGTSSPTLKLSIGIAAGTGGINHIYTGTGGPYSVANFTSNLDTGEVQIGGVRTNYFPTFYSSGSERMRIESSGTVLISKTTGSDTVAGMVFGNGSGDRVFTVGSSASWGVMVNRQGDDGKAINFRRANTDVGSINVTASATSYNTSSDYRLKENITPMTGALDKVAQLKPVTYKWKVDGSSGEGFIAHELQAVIPDCVTGAKDATQEQEYEVTPAVKDEQGNITTPAVMGTRTVPVYQGIDTSFLVATLTAALQETKSLIDTQAETINALTARIVALETK